MSVRYGHLKRISQILPCTLSGSHLLEYRKDLGFLVPSSILVSHSCGEINDTSVSRTGFGSQRYSTTLSKVPNGTPLPNVDCMSFIISSLDNLQGVHHCWLNRDERNKDLFKRDGTFLVLAGKFLDNPKIVTMLEKVKSLQQRFPHLVVMGIHTGSSTCPATDKTRLVELIMKEYIIFPILLSNRKFSEMENEPCYIMFKDFKDPVIYHETNLDFGTLNEAVEGLYSPNNGNVNDDTFSRSLKSTWWKQPEIIKDPCSCSLQNLLLYFPGCVSADESGNQLFLSDTNHHRIIIFDGNGKILDCIGSSPGFEDGEFESAKLARPAASFYHDAEDCLYIVDSENHAIRRADMQRRVLETLYPTYSISKKNISLWNWLMSKLTIGRNIDVKSEEFDSGSLFFPWHLLKLADNSILIVNRSFEALWIMDLATGKMIQFIKGFSKIKEMFGDLIMEKLSLFKHMPTNWLQQQIDANCSARLDASLISSATTFQNHIVMCDMVAHEVLKLHRESGASSGIQLSNYGILGFPYWLSVPLERVFSVAGHSGTLIDHIQLFNLLPGRVDIRINVEIPGDTILVEPLQEGYIWRQARGAATEVLGAEGIVASSEKVGVAQEWYDKMDNLVFSTPESEMVVEEDNRPSDLNLQDGKIHIDCAVNMSPGTSEVIICAPLYLKLRRHPDSQEDSREKIASRIVDIMNQGRNGGNGRDSVIQLLSKPKKDLRDLIFMRPLHVRIKLDVLDHPKADNGKDIIWTDSSVEVNVLLNT